MMTSKLTMPILVFLIAAALALVAPGCDSDDGENGSDTSDTAADTTTDTGDVTDTGDTGDATDTTDTDIVDVTDTTDTTDTADVTDTSDVLDLQGNRVVNIAFDARVGAEAVACGTTYMGVGTPAANIELKDFRFYVSNVRLLSGGAEYPVSLTDDDLWQSADVALLDFEDATAGCSDNGTAATNDTIVGLAPDLTYSGIAFDLGVQFDQNHQDVTAAESPLNVGAMFWVWQGGYKFVRIDMIDTDGMAPNNAWNLHLGSTGCMSAAPAVPPTTPCDKPNLPSIQLDNFDPETNTIVVDLAAVLADSNVTANTDMTPPGCQSFPPDVNECTPLFPHLGIDFATGECTNGCADQALFTVE